MKADLPKESGSALDYASLVSTLKVLDGERVCLSESIGEKSRLQTKGILRHYDYGWADGFAIGDGARLLLWEPDFVSAGLRTYDGNEHFQVTVKFGAVEFVVGDPGLIATDEIDLFP